jgi:hypothetical protein
MVTLHTKETILNRDKDKIQEEDRDDEVGQTVSHGKQLLKVLKTS